MDIQPLETQHQTTPSATIHQPRDLTWLGMADDRELLLRAREIATHNIRANQAAQVFAGLAAKLSSWEFAQA
jgi:hypothetical protein